MIPLLLLVSRFVALGHLLVSLYNNILPVTLVVAIFALRLDILWGFALSAYMGWLVFEYVVGKREMDRGYEGWRTRGGLVNE